MVVLWLLTLSAKQSRPNYKADLKVRPSVNKCMLLHILFEFLPVYHFFLAATDVHGVSDLYQCYIH
jgi:hypothetical protein